MRDAGPWREGKADEGKKRFVRTIQRAYLYWMILMGIRDISPWSGEGL